MMPGRYIPGLYVALLASAAWSQAVPVAPATPPTAMPELVLPGTAPAAAVPMLPAVGIMPPGEAGNTALPLVPDKPTKEVATAPTEAGSKFSYGNAANSLLFSPGQISAMKKALSAFESIRPDSIVKGDEPEVLFTEAAPIAEEVIPEPTTYPVYQLSSIAYRTPTDWTVWLNNARITPKTNNGDVTVTRVSPDRAWFRWEPTYAKAVVARVNKDEFAPIDAVKHRLTNPNTVSFDRQTGDVSFSLRPNQSFAAGYFRTFEGKIAAPTMPVAEEPTEISPDAANLFPIDDMPGTAPAEVAPAMPEMGQPSAHAPAAPMHENNAIMAPETANAINGLLDNTPPAAMVPAMPPVTPATPSPAPSPVGITPSTITAPITPPTTAP